MRAGEPVKHRPGARVRYFIDWRPDPANLAPTEEPYLPDGVAITGTPAWSTDHPSITLSGDTVASDITSVVAQGGIDGEVVVITCAVTLDDDDATEDSRSLTLLVRH